MPQVVPRDVYGWKAPFKGMEMASSYSPSGAGDLVNVMDAYMNFVKSLDIHDYASKYVLPLVGLMEVQESTQADP